MLKADQMTARDLGRFLTRSTARLLAVVFLVMLGLFLLTGLLTAAYRRERHDRAERQFQAGNRLAAAGRYSQAIQLFTEALALSRENAQFKLALALALLESGQAEKAEGYLLDLVRDDPAAAVPNLHLARIEARRGRTDAATQYYQRAIYGLWPDEPLRRRIETRFELIELLLRQGKYLQVQAELLRQLDEAPPEPALRKRIGRMLLASQAPEKARQVFEELATRFPRDAEVWAGLGDARFDLGQYGLAQEAYRHARRYNPSDVQSLAQLELIAEILRLDPRRPGLRLSRRLALSLVLLDRTLAELDPCVTRLGSRAPEEFRARLDRARRLVSKEIAPAPTEEALEANITLAIELFRAGRTFCGAPAAPDRALALLLEKLAGE
jgi:tetratricopeptide (TPR) repeat protein